MTDVFSIKLSGERMHSLSSLAFAHLGDAVYELLVRGMLCEQGRVTSTALHRETVKRVSAKAQAAAAEKILPALTEEEADVFRRARNAHVNSIPKSANIAEYHMATALEALFGWLYAQNEHERIKELFRMIMEEEYAS